MRKLWLAAALLAAAAPVAAQDAPATKRFVDQDKNEILVDLATLPHAGQLRLFYATITQPDQNVVHVGMEADCGQGTMRVATVRDPSGTYKTVSPDQVAVAKPTPVAGDPGAQSVWNFVCGKGGAN